MRTTKILLALTILVLFAGRVRAGMFENYGPQSITDGGGSITTDMLSEGTPGGALPTRALQIGGRDGATFHIVLVDSSGRVVGSSDRPYGDVATLPLSLTIVGGVNDLGIYDALHFDTNSAIWVENGWDGTTFRPVSTNTSGQTIVDSNGNSRTFNVNLVGNDVKDHRTTYSTGASGCLGICNIPSGRSTFDIDFGSNRAWAQICTSAKIGIRYGATGNDESFMLANECYHTEGYGGFRHIFVDTNTYSTATTFRPVMSVPE